jgi:hypothetical protein
MARMLDTPQRLPVQGTDTFGFAAIAGRSADGKTVQILISNYSIPAGFKPHMLQMPPESIKAGPPLPDFSKIKFLPPRADIVYRDNAGYRLMIDNLPWGKKPFDVKRYLISKKQDFDLVEETSATGGSLKLSSPLAPNAVELIVLQGK